MNDVEKLGVWGILVDVFILLPILFWWRKRRKEKTESLIYQRNESEKEGEMNG